MEDKNKNRKNLSEGIKKELNTLLDMNKKRKSALDKMSKSIMEKEKRAVKKQN